MADIACVCGGHISLDRREVLRYLGCEAELPGESGELITSCIREVEENLDCKACYSRFPVSFSPEGRLRLGEGLLASRQLARHLCGCSELILFTATIGLSVDRLLQRYSALSPARASAVQAAGTAAIEQWCDALCRRFSAEEAGRGNVLRPRFSPGYGDFPLEAQTLIFRLLDCGRRIGVTLTAGLQMLPSKSVSAVVGIRSGGLNCAAGGCSACRESGCGLRREDI